MNDYSASKFSTEICKSCLTSFVLPVSCDKVKIKIFTLHHYFHALLMHGNKHVMSCHVNPLLTYFLYLNESCVSGDCV